MKRVLKKGIVTLLTAALLAGSSSSALPLWQKTKVKAAEVQYVPLNQEFTNRKEAYFELTEHGVVTFGSNMDRVYRVLEDGNEVLYAYNASRLRLAPGKYKAELYYYGISKINFVSEESSPYTEKEWNGSLDNANEI